MEVWSIFFYITSVLIIVILVTLCYKKFPKGETGSCSNGTLVFSLILSAPGAGGGATITLESFSDLMILIWILGAISGIGVGILNFVYIKRKAKKSYNDYAFNHSTGLISAYSFLYFVVLGTLILLVEDSDPKEDSFLDIPFKYREHAWAYYLIELVYFSGLFLSTMGEYFAIKNDLPALIYIYFMLEQMMAYSFNLAILLDFKTAYILVIIIFSLVNILSGIYIWSKYNSVESFESPELAEKAEELGVTPNV